MADSFLIFGIVAAVTIVVALVAVIGFAKHNDSRTTAVPQPTHVPDDTATEASTEYSTNDLVVLTGSTLMESQGERQG